LRDNVSRTTHACRRTVFIAAGLALLQASGCGSNPTDTEPRATAPQVKVSSDGGSPEAASVNVASTRAVATAAANRLRDLSFDDVKFEMEKGDPFTRDLLPPAVSALESQRIRIRGYILPSFQQEGITQFVLVRDNMECCFGPGAALYDCVVVRMLPGRSTRFSVRPVAVTGTFHLEELIGPDGRHLAIYSLDGEQVE